MNRHLKAFTLIELVVTATILVILTSIGFYSYTQNISDARDSRRKTDLPALSSQLNLYKKQRGAYPLPGDNFEIRNRGFTVAYQGFMNQKVTLSTAEKLPFDPETESPYFYSITRNKQEFQIAASVENNESPYTIMEGSYKSVAKNVLPTLLLATGSTSPVEIGSASGASAQANRNLFLYHNGIHTLPYDFIDRLPKHDGTGFTGALLDAQKDFWQNSDFRSCDEIFIAGKGIGPSGTTDEYQIVANNGGLTNTGCLTP